MNRKKQQTKVMRKQKSISEIYNVNFVGIATEAEKLRRRLHISRREWKKLRRR